jgi:hypothetical protein
LRDAGIDDSLGRARAWLNANLFLDDVAPRWSASSILVGALLAIAGVALVILRMRTSFPFDSLWAEDGHHWLANARDLGFFDALTSPVQGYIELAPGLIAEPASAVPLADAPSVITVCAATVVVGCAFVVWRASAAQIPNPYLRLGLAAIVPLTPVVGIEGIDSATNVHWFLDFAAFWVLLWRPTSMRVAVAAGGLMFLAALTDGLMLLLVPLALLRLIAGVDRRDVAILAGLGAGLALQVGFVLIDDSFGGYERNFTASALAGYPQRIVGGVLFGYEVNGDLWRGLGPPYAVALTLALGAFVLAGLRRAERRVPAFVGVSVLASIVIFYFSVYQRDVTDALSWPQGSSSNTLPRYTILPFLLLVSAVFVQLGSQPRSIPRAGWNGLRLGVVTLIMVAAITSFDVGDPALRGSPTWTDALADARAGCRETGRREVNVAISPPGWVTRRPCAELVGH